LRIRVGVSLIRYQLSESGLRDETILAGLPEVEEGLDGPDSAQCGCMFRYRYAAYRRIIGLVRVFAGFTSFANLSHADSMKVTTNNMSRDKDKTKTKTKRH
jgi:hypothetical protein